MNHGNKTTVLQVINRFGVGGSEAQSMELIRRLDRNRYESVIATMTPDGPWRSVMEQLGVEILVYPFEKFYDKQGLGHFRHLASVIRQRDIKLVHCHDFYSNIFGCFAGAIAGRVKVIAARREVGILRKRHQLFGQRVAYLFADVILTNAQHLANRLVHQELVASQRVRIVRNGVDAKRFGSPRHPTGYRETLGIPAGAQVIGMIARLTAEKNHPCLFRAVADLVFEFPDLRVVVVGDGPLRSELSDLARSLELNRNILFLGERHDIAEILELIDIHVLTSSSEGLSNVLLEAFAACTPVVASAVGGNMEVVDEGVDGFLVPHDDHRQLATRLRSLLRDPGLRATMGRAGQQKVSAKFSFDRMVSQVEELYVELLVQ